MIESIQELIESQGEVDLTGVNWNVIRKEIHTCLLQSDNKLNTKIFVRHGSNYYLSRNEDNYKKAVNSIYPEHTFSYLVTPEDKKIYSVTFQYLKNNIKKIMEDNIDCIYTIDNSSVKNILKLYPTFDIIDVNYHKVNSSNLVIFTDVRKDETFKIIDTNKSIIYNSNKEL